MQLMYSCLQVPSILQQTLNIKVPIQKYYISYRQFTSTKLCLFNLLILVHYTSHLVHSFDMIRA